MSPDEGAYGIRLEPLAMQQLAGLDADVWARARGLLAELADLAAFAAKWSLVVADVSSLVAIARGVTMHYVIDDARRCLTVTGVSAHEPAMPAGRRR